MLTVTGPGGSTGTGRCITRGAADMSSITGAPGISRTAASTTTRPGAAGISSTTTRPTATGAPDTSSIAAAITDR